MKKILLFLLSVSMLLTVTACSGNSDSNVDEPEKTEAPDIGKEDACPLPELDYDLETVTIHVRGDDDSIGEIASSVGIPDSLYFSKMFKKHFGVSPREYRCQND